MKQLSIKPIDEATAYLWKKETVDYLKGMEDVPEQMEADLMRMLRPHYKAAGHLLLEPLIHHNDAVYLRKGLVKLYLLDAKTGKQQIMHIWVPGEIIVLYHMFRRRLLNAKYYIEVITSGELVSISNDWMDLIYKDYAVATTLTLDILENKSERMTKQMEILGIECKADRYKRFVELFPELENKLCNEDLCAFLSISEPTLIKARGEYLKKAG